MANTGVQISALPSAQALSGQEIVPLVAVGHISGITKAAVAVITISDATPINPFVPGETFAIQGVAGMVEINGPPGAPLTITAVGGVSGAWTITVPINSSGFTTYASGGTITATVGISLRQLLLAAGLYNATFQSGNVQYTGPGGTLAGDNNLIFGKNLPNPSGIPGAALLIGSGGGLGIPVTASIIMDQAFDNSTPGNNLIVTSGETQGAGTANGGAYNDYGGASFGGTGGLRQVQGGTSANAAAGPTIIAGGNATGSTAAAVPGDVFSIAGQVGQQGATNHWIATILNGIAGFLRHRFNSTITIDELFDGSWFFYGVGGGTFGAAGAPLISRGPGNPMGPAIPGTDVVATHVEVINGKTFTWTNGLLTSVV